jgi:hypothetical protein
MQRGLRGSRFSAVALAAVRRRGWAHSVGEREAGVASVSAPVRSPRERSSPRSACPVQLNDCRVSRVGSMHRR